jgi:hypothetical protein
MKKHLTAPTQGARISERQKKQKRPAAYVEQRGLHGLLRARFPTPKASGSAPQGINRR